MITFSQKGLGVLRDHYKAVTQPRIPIWEFYALAQYALKNRYSGNSGTIPLTILALDKSKDPGDITIALNRYMDIIESPDYPTEYQGFLTASTIDTLEVGVVDLVHSHLFTGSKGQTLMTIGSKFHSTNSGHIQLDTALGRLGVPFYTLMAPLLNTSTYSTYLTDKTLSSKDPVMQTPFQYWTPILDTPGPKKELEKLFLQLIYTWGALTNDIGRISYLVRPSRHRLRDPLENLCTALVWVWMFLFLFEGKIKPHFLRFNSLHRLVRRIGHMLAHKEAKEIWGAPSNKKQWLLYVTHKIEALIYRDPLYLEWSAKSAFKPPSRKNNKDKKEQLREEMKDTIRGTIAHTFSRRLEDIRKYTMEKESIINSISQDRTNNRTKVGIDEDQRNNMLNLSAVMTSTPSAHRLLRARYAARQIQDYYFDTINALTHKKTKELNEMAMQGKFPFFINPLKRQDPYRIYRAVATKPLIIYGRSRPDDDDEDDENENRHKYGTEYQAKLYYGYLQVLFTGTQIINFDLGGMCGIATSRVDGNSMHSFVYAHPNMEGYISSYDANHYGTMSVNEAECYNGLYPSGLCMGNAGNAYWKFMYSNLPKNSNRHMVDVKVSSDLAERTMALLAPREAQKIESIPDEIAHLMVEGVYGSIIPSLGGVLQTLHNLIYHPGMSEPYDSLRLSDLKSSFPISRSPHPENPNTNYNYFEVEARGKKIILAANPYAADRSPVFNNAYCSTRFRTIPNTLNGFRNINENNFKSYAKGIEAMLDYIPDAREHLIDTIMGLDNAWTHPLWSEELETMLRLAQLDFRVINHNAKHPSELSSVKKIFREKHEELYGPDREQDCQYLKTGRSNTTATEQPNHWRFEGAYHEALENNNDATAVESSVSWGVLQNLRALEIQTIANNTNSSTDEPLEMERVTPPTSEEVQNSFRYFNLLGRTDLANELAVLSSRLLGQGMAMADTSRPPIVTTSTTEAEPLVNYVTRHTSRELTAGRVLARLREWREAEPDTEGFGLPLVREVWNSYEHLTHSGEPVLQEQGSEMMSIARRAYTPMGLFSVGDREPSNAMARNMLSSLRNWRDDPERRSDHPLPSAGFVRDTYRYLVIAMQYADANEMRRIAIEAYNENVLYEEGIPPRAVGVALDESGNLPDSRTRLEDAFYNLERLRDIENNDYEGEEIVPTPPSMEEVLSAIRDFRRVGMATEIDEIVDRATRVLDRAITIDVSTQQGGTSYVSTD